MHAIDHRSNAAKRVNYFVQHLITSSSLPALYLATDILVNAFVRILPAKDFLTLIIQISNLVGYKRLCRVCSDILSKYPNITFSELEIIVDRDFMAYNHSSEVGHPGHFALDLLSKTSHLLSYHIVKGSQGCIFVDQLIEPDTFESVDGVSSVAVSPVNAVGASQEIRLTDSLTFEKSLASFASLNTFLFIGAPQPSFNLIHGTIDLPSDYKNLIDDISLQSSMQIGLTLATDMRIAAWQNFPAHGESSQHLIPFSSKGVMYLSRMSESEPDYLFAYSPFVSLKNRNEGPNLFGVKYSYFDVVEEEIRTPCFFLGGHRTFGHWMLDILPLLLLTTPEFQPPSISNTSIGHMLSSMPIITTPLVKWQRESLGVLCNDRQIIEVSSTEGQLKLVSVPELWLAGGLSLSSRYEYLRRAFSNAFADCTNTSRSSSNEYIYISRSKWDPSGRERVKNFREISSVFESYGFVEISAEDYSYRELYALLSGAKIVAVDPGSPRFNAFIFAPETAVHLVLYPKPAFINEASVERDAFWHLPFLDKTVFVHGDTSTEPDPLTAPIYYSPTSLSEGIRRAKLLCQV
jgi:hypothetical protein